MNQRALLTAIGFAMAMTACGTAQPPAPAPAPLKIEVTIYPQATRPAKSDIIRINAPAGEPRRAQPAIEPAISAVLDIEPTATPVSRTAIVAPSAGKIEGIRNEMLMMHNAARAAHGLAPYSINDTLQQAAQMHAEWLAKKPMPELWSLGVQAHFGPGNQSYVDRISAAGYATAANRMNENYGAFGSANDAFEWWMNDAAGAATHRPQVLSSLYTEIGIGVVKHDSGMGYVFIINFATR